MGVSAHKRKHQHDKYKNEKIRYHARHPKSHNRGHRHRQLNEAQSSVVTNGMTNARDMENSCLRKVMYDTEEEAQTAGRLCVRDGRLKPPLYVYKCRYCHGWHLSHVYREGESIRIDMDAEHVSKRVIRWNVDNRSKWQ